jgi:hypothetical protein
MSRWRRTVRCSSRTRLCQNNAVGAETAES